MRLGQRRTAALPRSHRRVEIPIHGPSSRAATYGGVPCSCAVPTSCWHYRSAAWQSARPATTPSSAIRAAGCLDQAEHIRLPLGQARGPLVPHRPKVPPLSLPAASTAAEFSTHRFRLQGNRRRRRNARPRTRPASSSWGRCWPAAMRDARGWSGRKPAARRARSRAGQSRYPGYWR